MGGCAGTRDPRLGDRPGLWTNELAFAFLFVINLLNYVDRGIIPGAEKEFLGFISDAVGTGQPDLFLGLLQSAFIIGFSIAALVFGHLIHFYPPFRLAGVGLTVWVVATLLCGLAKHTGSYVFLLFARMLSGVGEASFQCVAPPFITDLGGDAAGRWLGLFYTAIPVGTAGGYPWGSIFAKSDLGWSWAFFVESLLMAPLALSCFFVPFTWRPERPPIEESDDEGGAVGEDKHLLGGTLAEAEEMERERHVTVKEELLAVLSRPIYILTALGYAAQTGMMIGVSTFGSALLLEFGYFQQETSASTIFGLMLSLAGILGTPLGGFLVDRRTFRSEESKLAFLARQNLICVVLGFAACALSCFVHPKGLFLASLGVGALLLFAATASINYVTMLAVPPANRSFAIGLSTLTIHALGDVPSPIIVGAILDRMAPDCASALKDSGDGDSDFTLTPACESQLPRVRLTMFITTLYLLVSVVTFALAYVMAVRQKRRHDAARRHAHEGGSIADRIRPLLEERESR